MSPIKTIDVLIYRPGVMLPEPAKIELPLNWKFGDMNKAIAPLIGDGNLIEHVAVLFHGSRHDMFVDEYSAINPRKSFDDPELPDADPQPVNEAATLIYHEAPRVRGESTKDAPKIHGVAVLTLTRIWT